MAWVCSRGSGTGRVKLLGRALAETPVVLAGLQKLAWKTGNPVTVVQRLQERAEIPKQESEPKERRQPAGSRSRAQKHRERTASCLKINRLKRLNVKPNDKFKTVPSPLWSFCLLNIIYLNSCSPNIFIANNILSGSVFSISLPLTCPTFVPYPRHPRAAQLNKQTNTFDKYKEHPITTT